MPVSCIHLPTRLKK